MVACYDCESILEPSESRKNLNLQSYVATAMYVLVDRHDKIVSKRVVDNTSVPLDQIETDLVENLLIDYNTYMDKLPFYNKTRINKVRRKKI